MIRAGIVTPVLAALLLAGCSLFTPERPVPREFHNPAVTDAQRQRDIDSCREQARAMVRRDENIAADIASRSGRGAASPDLTRKMNAFDAQRRYQRIFEGCMRGRGYVKGQSSDALAHAFQ